ncbi:MAG: hypothetical protein JWL64_1258 [Frankiales bacterium]|nr:hypothetical protein [Frankiales bacterium]
MTARVSRKQIGRLAAAHLAVGVMGGGVLLLATGSSAVELREPAATPAATCGPGSMPETGRQGRVEPADRADGRSALG